MFEDLNGIKWYIIALVFVSSHIKQVGLVWFMVFNVTFNNISVILWQSVLLVEETT
jgi:hypothetical protein